MWLISRLRRPSPSEEHELKRLRNTAASARFRAKKKKREQSLERIWIDPKRCFGKPCIRGHRIWVSLILDLLASGSTISEILEDYPDLTEADIQACIAYGAEMARERYVDIPLEPAV